MDVGQVVVTGPAGGAADATTVTRNIGVHQSATTGESDTTLGAHYYFRAHRWRLFRIDRHCVPRFTLVWIHSANTCERLAGDEVVTSPSE